MVNSKNSLNLKPTKNTLEKGLYSSRRVDGIVKKENICKTENKITEVKKIPIKKEEALITSKIIKEEINNSSIDDSKRMFLKVAGVAGLGLAASALFPKSSEAYVSGSTPTSNVVGIKNIANVKIDPATESKQDAILTELQLKADLTETQPVSIASTVNVGVSGISNAIGINDGIGSRINPAQDDSIILLRRMVKLMESQAVVDNQMRQRVVVDLMPTTTVTGTVTVGSITSVNQLAGVDSRWQIIDWSRQTYNSGIRGNLLNS